MVLAGGLDQLGRPYGAMLDRHTMPKPTTDSPWLQRETWERLTIECPMSGAAVLERGE